MICGWAALRLRLLLDGKLVCCLRNSDFLVFELAILYRMSEQRSVIFCWFWLSTVILLFVLCIWCLIFRSSVPGQFSIRCSASSLLSLHSPQAGVEMIFILERKPPNPPWFVKNWVTTRPQIWESRSPTSSIQFGIHLPPTGSSWS